MLGCGFIREFHSSFALLILRLRFRPLIHYSTEVKGTVMQIEKALTNDHLRVSKVF